MIGSGQMGDIGICIGNGIVSGSNMDNGIGIGLDINNSLSGNNRRWDDDNSECGLECDTPDCHENIDTIQTYTECNVSYCQSCFDNHQDEHGVCATLGSRNRR